MLYIVSVILSKKANSHVDIGLQADTALVAATMAKDMVRAGFDLASNVDLKFSVKEVGPPKPGMANCVILAIENMPEPVAA